MLLLVKMLHRHPMPPQIQAMMKVVGAPTMGVGGGGDWMPLARTVKNKIISEKRGLDIYIYIYCVI